MRIEKKCSSKSKILLFVRLMPHRASPVLRTLALPLRRVGRQKKTFARPFLGKVRGFAAQKMGSFFDAPNQLRP
jgi:hypothetical protein